MDTLTTDRLTARPLVKPARVRGRGRGFKSMPLERVREIASMGGKAAHAQGTAHKWTSEEARAAGQKGGHISRRRRRVEA